MMTNSFDIVFSVLPIFGLFVFGHLLQRLQFFTLAAVRDLKKFVVSVTLPCLLFIAFSQLELELRLLAIVVIVFAVCAVMVAIGHLIAKSLHIASPYFPLLFGGFETGMLGYAIFIAVYGFHAVDKLALVDLGQVVFVFFVLMALLIKLRDGVQRPAQLVQMFLTSPVIFAILAGMLVSVLNNAPAVASSRTYEAFNNLMTMLGNVTVPVICLVIGYEFQLDVKTLRLAALTILARTTLLLGLALLINKIIFAHFLQIDPLYEYALLTMFVLPPPFVIALFLKDDDTANRQYVINTLSLSTIVSLIVFIVVMMVYE